LAKILMEMSESSVTGESVIPLRIPLKKRTHRCRPLSSVRPAGRMHLEVEVLYTLGKEKC